MEGDRERDILLIQISKIKKLTLKQIPPFVIKLIDEGGVNWRPKYTTIHG